MVEEYKGLGCAECGSCCENIWMYPGFDPNRVTDNEADQWTLKFVREFWELQKMEEGTGWQVWTCSQFDNETRLCKAHESRPPICSGYPWYGEKPIPRRYEALGKQCSYLLDVSPENRPEGSRPLIPVTVIRG